jgi:hypothetical protein
MILQFFPEEFLALQQEIIHHPDLQNKLANHPSTELEVRIAEVASHCNILLDDTYDENDLKRLAKILTKRLFESRTKLILPPV